MLTLLAVSGCLILLHVQAINFMCTAIFLRKRKLLSQGSLTTSSSVQLKFASVASGSTLAFFFGCIFTLSNDETTLSLVTIPTRMFPELSLCVNGHESKISFQCKR